MAERSPVRRIDEILIQVADVQRSVKFYRDGLGIHLKPAVYGDNSFEGRIGGVRFLLHPDFDSSLKNARRGVGIHIHFWIPDADAYYDRLRRKGIQIVEPLEDRPWGRHLAVVDPDGYRIEILGPVKIAKHQRNARKRR